MNLKKLLLGNARKDSAERIIILGIVAGAVLAGLGMLGTIPESQGTASAVALIGSFITFVSTVVLVLYWFVTDGK